MIFLIFAVFSHGETYIGLTLFVLLLLVYTVATVRVFILPHIRITNEFIFISPTPLWKTYKIGIYEIEFIQRIEQGENTGFLFYLRNGAEVKYIPQMQDIKLIEEIITVMSSVAYLNKRWKH